MAKSAMVRRVTIVAFEGVQSLDVTGPLEVFAHASREQYRERGVECYEVVVASCRGGVVRSSSGLDLVTHKLMSGARGDTLLVAGGNEAGLAGATSDQRLLKWLRTWGTKFRRVASVCSGAFILAKAGLLDGHRVATHWGSAERLAALYPCLGVDSSAIFVESGRIWTSAGVTAGIDMALAMVERDLSPKVASRVAAELVLPARRLGFQSQFSDLLAAQVRKDSPLAAALQWAAAHLPGLDVPTLAAQAGMSMRSLHRLCRAAAQTTPGKLIEQLRTDQVRVLLATTTLGLKQIAVECGYRDASEVTRAFTRRFGLSPTDYRSTQRIT
jgi:transcriptional regulator GlxA family with amidase domain